MSLGNLAGVGALRESLDVTNDHLAAVLDELRTTNGRALESIAAELRLVNERLADLHDLLAADERPAAVAPSRNGKR